MIVRAFNSGPMEDVRQIARAAADRLAFVFESVCIAAVVLVLLTLSPVRFDGIAGAQQWGGFLTHFADASPEARLPVTRFLAIVLVVLTGMVAATRFKKARLNFEPFRRAAGARADVAPDHGQVTISALPEAA